MNPNRPIQSTRFTARLCPALGAGKALVLAAAVVAAVASGCATESKLVREDPGFTAESLRKGGLAVLGVVQVDEVAQARPPLVAALERVFASARREVPLVRADRAQAAMG